MLRSISIFSAVLWICLVSGMASAAGGPLAMGIGSFEFDPLDVMLTAGTIVGSMALVSGLLIGLSRASVTPVFVGIAMATMLSSMSAIFEATELQEPPLAAAATLPETHAPVHPAASAWGGDGF